MLIYSRYLAVVAFSPPRYPPCARRRGHGIRFCLSVETALLAWGGAGRSGKCARRRSVLSPGLSSSGAFIGRLRRMTGGVGSRARFKGRDCAASRAGRAPFDVVGLFRPGLHRQPASLDPQHERARVDLDHLHPRQSACSPVTQSRARAWAWRGRASVTGSIARRTRFCGACRTASSATSGGRAG